MMSLFSSFDLAPFNASMLPYLFMMMFCSMGLKKVSCFKVNLASYKIFSQSFHMNLPRPLKMSIQLLFTVLMASLVLNLLSMGAYLFPLTSQISMVGALALLVYITLVMMSLNFSSNYMLMHMIPQGTPMNLSWVVFMIEVVSSIIRPVTLSMRLVANILAGHLLLTLMASLVMVYSLSVIGHMSLTMVEMGVGLVQSFIFSMMCSIYMKDFS